MKSHFFITGFAVGVLIALGITRLSPERSGSHQAQAVEGTLTISGSNQTITGDVTVARLVDQANTAYFIDPASSTTSLTTAGKVGLGTTTITDTINLPSSGTIGYINGGKIKDSSGSLQIQAGGTGTGSTGTASIYFLNSSGTVKGRFETITDVPSTGDGVDGAITVSSSTNINTTNLISGRSCADGGDMVAYSVSSVTDSDTVVLSSTPSSGCLAAGDEMLLINLQGDGTDAVNVGNWEILEISSISIDTINFTTAKNRYYGDDADDDTNIGTATTNQRVMLQRVPNYTNVTVNSSQTLSSSDWDGTKYGVLMFKATGTVTVTGNITQDGKGYRGGAGSGSGAGTRGEEILGSYSSGTSLNTICGGRVDPQSYAVNGGGGGHATMGFAATSVGGNGDQDYVNGNTWGDPQLTKLGFGCAGAGANYSGGTAGNAGTDGGGGVAVFAGTITVSGTISADGTDQSDGGSNDYDGGSGAGGSIWLSAASLTLGNGLVTAKGGTNDTNVSSGRWGGDGYIRLDYGTAISGTTRPLSQYLRGQTYGTFYTGSTNTSSSDLAEYYTAGETGIEAGDVVTIRQNGKNVDNKGVLMKTDKPYDRNLIGIISTKPGVLMGSDDLDSSRGEKRMLALAGRVPVKIDPSSPAIAVGDFLTSSAIPGLAVKATQFGYVVARALESWQPDGPDKIEAFIQLTYYMGNIDERGDFRTLEVDTLKANTVKTKELNVDGVNVLQEIKELHRQLENLKRTPSLK